MKQEPTIALVYRSFIKIESIFAHEFVKLIENQWFLEWKKYRNNTSLTKGKDLSLTLLDLSFRHPFLRLFMFEKCQLCHKGSCCCYVYQT